MSSTDLIDLVQQSASFDSDAQAEQLVTATLAHLGECLSPGEVEDLATALPPQFAEAVRVETPTDPSPKSLDAFLDAIHDETGIPRDELEPKIRAVTAALRETVGDEELENMAAQLPPEYERIVAEESSLAESFVEALETHSVIESHGEAQIAARTTLRTLGERLARGEAQDIAAYLQGDAAEWLIDEDLERASGFDTDEFVDRLALRADVSHEQARRYAEAVAEVLGEVVPARELSRASEQLPPAYDALLELPET